jgi:hypothetical protein
VVFLYRDIVDILGFDVADKLSDDIVKDTAMAYPTLSPLSAGSKNTKTLRMDIKHIGRIRLSECGLCNIKREGLQCRNW